MRRSRTRLLAYACTVIALRSFCGESPRHVFGHVAYPALGNIHLDEGTLEAWVTICFDPYEKTTSSWYARAAIFDLALSRRHGLGATWAIKENPRDKKRGVASQLWTGFSIGGRKFFHLATYAKMEWKEGRTFHYALAWRDRVTTLFIDGKQVNQVSQPSSLQAEISSKAILWLGGRWSGASTLAIIDELRVSSVVRRPDELGHASPGPLAAEPHTLLLDHLDIVRVRSDGKKETVADVMAQYDGRTGGLVSAGCRSVDGRRGKAIALFTEKRQ